MNSKRLAITIIGLGISTALLARAESTGDRTTAHWAFRPVTRPDLPAVHGSAWCRNGIDRFVMARLERETLVPSPEADRVTLMRRLCLDLIGLPPTVHDVDAFLADRHADAYERLVNRLLDSPHYGEKWGRHWLDAARYADSDGFEKDKPRNVYFYRDWVIDALNRDLPYDRFIIEQIAGDLLPQPTQGQVVATGFLRNSMINEEGGIDPEQFRMEAMFDRMDAIGKSILGLTIQCAQCHDHKYDPISQEDYYRLFAYLNNDHEASVAVYAAAELARRAEILRGVQQIELELKHRTPDWRARMDAWEESVRDTDASWQVVRPELDESGGQKHYVLKDGSILAAGYAPTKHTTEFVAKTSLSRVAAVRLELLNDANLPLGGPGRSVRGLCALTELSMAAAPAGDPAAKKDVKFVRASAVVNPPEQPLEKIFDDKSNKRRVTGPVEFALDAKDETAWGIDIGPGRSNVPRKAVFVVDPPVEFPSGAVLTFKLVQNHGGWNSDDNQNNNLGRFRFAVTDQSDAVADPIPSRVRAILAIANSERSAAQVDAVFSYWRGTVEEWREANERIEQLWQQHPLGASQLVLAARNDPRRTALLWRGDFLKPLRTIEPGVPSFLHGLPAGGGRDRLAFAQWLVDPKSPTTARAIVNRVWQTYFGTGLVRTSEDLGMQSEPPSHPELLDWLSAEFMARGWSLKELHRLVVQSATYRQASLVSPQLLARDPENRLLARGPRFRVDAEVVRDIALAASGLLNPRVGGPSVFPPAPAFLFQPPISYGPKVWHEESGENQFRRALYTFRFRSVPYPMLQAFDAPNGDFSCVRRARSNTPLQALVMLNEPVFARCAEALARRTLQEGGTSDSERIDYAFRRCLARAPSDAERSELLALIGRTHERFAELQAAGRAAAEGSVAASPARDPALTAWTAACRVLLCLDETITKE